ncbi:MAG: hypothetical protein IKQ09_04345 [Bacteroidales bacterium]|nr:hypothetical protein [Bacteroidales bacterium]
MERNAMATVTRQRKTPEKSVVVTFNPKDRNAVHIIDMMRLMDFFSVTDAKPVESKNSIDRSIEEIKNGKYHVAKDGKDLIKQCLG